MASKLVKDNHSSLPAISERMAFFSMPPREKGVQRKYYVDKRPISQLTDPSSPYVFELSNDSTDMIDLPATRLHVKAKLLKKDGTTVAKEDYASVTNLLLHSLWEKVEVEVKKKAMTDSTLSYPYISYFKTMKCLGKANSLSLPSIGFSLDKGDMDAPGMVTPAAGSTEARKYNRGGAERFTWLEEGKVFEMEGPLLSDLFECDRYLLNNCPMTLSLTRSKSPFVVLARNNEEDYVLHLDDVYVKMCYVQPSPAAILGIDAALEKDHKALYPMTRSELKSYNIPEGYNDIRLENLFMNKVPKFVMLGLVSMEGKNGQYNKNPFNFKHYDIRRLGLSVNGAYIPGKPLDMNFTGSGQNYVTPYRNFVQCMEGNGLNGVTMDMFKNGYSIFVFNIEPEEKGTQDPGDIPAGSVNLELNWGTALPETVSLIVYAEFPMVMKLGKSRSPEFCC